MAKLTRITQTIFASLAGINQIGEFGSLAQGTPTTTTDPAAVQTATFAAGWFAAVLGNNSPAMEDMNGVFFEITYQLAYLCQAGVQEWDNATAYYIGSIANDGTGNLYVSITNNNVNNVLTDTGNWKSLTVSLSALGDLVYGGALGNATRLPGNTTTVRKYLSQTGTGSVSTAPSWQPLQVPTVTKITSGSGNYTVPAGVYYIEDELVGAGGGGGGGGITGQTAGGTGGDTTFGSSTAHGGTGGDGGGGNGGTGGTPSVGAGATDDGSFAGGDGQGTSIVEGGAGSTPGGQGGVNSRGGNGGGGYQSDGSAGKANTGAGGGGGGSGTGSLSISGAGGGAGARVKELRAVTPGQVIAYSIGVAGTAGAVGSGSGAGNGGEGATGGITIKEFPQ